MNNHYINIPFSNSNAKHTIFNNFNYEIIDSLYTSFNNKNIPIIYNFIHRYIKSLNKECRPVIFSPDYSISSASCTAIAEKYMNKISENDIQKYVSELKILYFTSSTHLNTLENMTPQNFSESILSNILDLNEISYTEHNLILQPNNIILVGINDNLVSPDEIVKLNDKNISYYTLSKIKKKGAKKISDEIFDEICEDPVYVIYDMSVFNFEKAPSVFRLQNITDANDINGLNTDDIIEIFEKLKNINIVGLDITGFKLNKNVPDISFKITSECAKLPLIHLLGLKEKRINIFNENTKILICKPITKEEKEKEERKYLLKKLKKNLDLDLNSDPTNNNILSDSDNEDNNNENNSIEEYKEIDDDGIDHGWYIMRNVPIETKEELIKKLMEIKDNIMFCNFGEDSMYISFTTIGEQENKSYAIMTSIYDRVLVPDEKVNLAFSQLC
jgi:arginase family enzyme